MTWLRSQNDKIMVECLIVYLRTRRAFNCHNLSTCITKRNRKGDNIITTVNNALRVRSPEFDCLVVCQCPGGNHVFRGMTSSAQNYICNSNEVITSLVNSLLVHSNLNIYESRKIYQAWELEK